MDVAAALARAVELARRGTFAVEPNPRVGAVLLDARGELVAEGHHAHWGGPHAEVVALQAAGARARGATLCVTLEPCSTRGKTPACTDALLSAGISRVVAGCRDPNPAHAGRGLDALRAAGLDVVEASDPECLALLPRFTAHLARQATAPDRQSAQAGGRPPPSPARPWVLAKWAMSRDGAIAPPGGGPAPISGEASRIWLHRVRAHLDAIVVGVGTVLADDPDLTARGDEAAVRPLRRVVLDPDLRTPLGCRLVATAGQTATWIFTTEDADEQPQSVLENEGARVVRIPGGDDWLSGVLGALHLSGVGRLMVEGGATTLGGFLGVGLVDQVAVLRGPRDLGPGALPALPGRRLGGLEPAALAAALGLHEVDVRRLGDDLLVQGFTRAAAD